MVQQEALILFLIKICDQNASFSFFCVIFIVLENSGSMKEEEIKLSQQKWSKENEPFAGHKEKFQSIHKSQRSAFRQKVLTTEQNPDPPPVIFKKEFPSFGKFKYQGYSLHYHSIQSTQSPQAIVVYVHGLNGHGGGSGYFASVITENNPKINFYAFDQMNFGQSEGPYRGQIVSLQDTLNQAETFVEFLLGKLKSKPKIFLSGGSYGGTVCFKACLKSPQKYQGAIFLAPALRNLPEAAPFMKKMGKFIGFLCPRIRLFKEDKFSGTKFNQIQRILADPYVYNDGIVPGSIRTILNSMDEVSLQYKQFSTPDLLFQAGVDKLVDLFAPLDLEEQCQSKDKTTIYCQKMWHAVLAEDEMEAIAWKTAEWLKQRV